MNPAAFSALAEEHRLQIVELLSQKSRPVNELVERLHINQPQVSKHLKVLSDAGIVDVKPIAQKHYYHLQSKVFKDMDHWLKKYRRLWEVRFDRLDALLKKEQNRGELKL